MMGRKRAQRKKRTCADAPGDGFAELFDAIRNIFQSLPRLETEQITVYKEIAIPEEMFRKLVMLCHPDKHGNSELSHEVTRWLIDQRKK